MSLTFGELDKLNLTFDEIGKLNLTFGKWDKLTYDSLLKLAKEKLDKFKSLSDDIPIPNDVNEQIDKIYKTASEKIPSLKVKRELKWTKSKSYAQSY